MCSRTTASRRSRRVALAALVIALLPLARAFLALAFARTSRQWYRMVPLEASGPNAEQIRYWNETAGPKWTAFQQVLDEQLGALGRRAMDRAGVARRERAIDVGCGCGDTTIELGRRVGPQGTVVGIDLSAPMLERAATQARAAQLANVRFENADAQTHRFAPGQCDLVFSRFGVMFFADPVTAFMNLCVALRPGG